MPRGNPAIKLAVTVDADVHSKLVVAAAAEGTSVSAWITAAARRALLIRDGLAAVAEWEAEHGALTQAELEAARARIGRSNVRRKRQRTMRPVVYDTGVLIAADRSERHIWAEHRARLEAGVIPLVPAPVVAQASRSPKQAQLRRLLRGAKWSRSTRQEHTPPGYRSAKPARRTSSMPPWPCSRVGIEQMWSATMPRMFGGSCPPRARKCQSWTRESPSRSKPVATSQQVQRHPGGCDHLIADFAAGDHRVARQRAHAIRQIVTEAGSVTHAHGRTGRAGRVFRAASARLRCRP